MSFERPGPQRRILVVYIEGDGRAWINPWRPASDPTPPDPIGLRLAAADPAQPLIYLARPCQFVTAGNCQDRLWTSDRFSSLVIAAYQKLIDENLAHFGSDQVGLVGYSGGGALATLIAEERHDVAWLITVGANLDLQEWSRLQDLEFPSGSLDPAAGAKAIKQLPQIHFAGDNDAVVPPAIVLSFVSGLPLNAPYRVLIVPGFDHKCCWTAMWPELVGRAGFQR